MPVTVHSKTLGRPELGSQLPGLENLLMIKEGGGIRPVLLVDLTIRYVFLDDPDLPADPNPESKGLKQPPPGCSGVGC